jgi:imidazolonepropionase-like amidohydrolase
MTDEEVAIAVKEVQMRGKRLAAHARSCASLKQCVRHGIEIIYHASFTDEEVARHAGGEQGEAFRRARHRHLSTPMLNEAEPWGITRKKAIDMGYEIEWAARWNRCARCTSAASACCRRRLWLSRSRRTAECARPGVLRAHLGFTPDGSVALGNRYGAEIMMKGNELGQIKEGYLADVLLVDGDPLSNLVILREPSRMLAVMKDGVFYKEPEIRSARRSLSAA